MGKWFNAPQKSFSGKKARPAGTILESSPAIIERTRPGPKSTGAALKYAPNWTQLKDAREAAAKQKS
jgi:hypothetical protein